MFEWDERKRCRNIAERAIDFVDVLSVFDDPERVEFEDARRDYRERRLIVLCPVQGRLFHVTYTLHGANRRIISARKANRREQRAYDRHRSSDDQGDPHR